MLKVGAFAGLRARLDPMAEEVRDAPHDGQPQAQTLAAVARQIADLVEFLEDPVQMLGRNADAGVLDGDAQPVPYSAPYPAADNPDVAGYRVAQSVLDQIPEHAPEQRPVAAHPVGAGFDPPAQALGRGYRCVAGGDLVEHRRRSGTR